ncbi:anaerobic ribonucleoside-triphosphate reductase [Clostridium sp. AF32-12BH]|uniref:anaerobic ribonucleoside-triphosphate reductase n=1 Tax=Clostridium sp. AF32-12BH TaxID=2292006 RepID=UPI000E4F3FFA|nr:anaerobic ribonucleoside-triphosphate reductase [Clostridium sp. AF32-12BH]RHP46889.1 anaerobic ribonucleoside-triphosphate reductase [Clostridium sp. AF32-12BH]
MTKVIKRDGRKVEFNPNKIREAVLKAFEDVDKEVTSQAKIQSSNIANYVKSLDQDSISVEEIQDIVENKLMASKRKDVAKSFILYRNDRTRVRESKMKLMNDIREKLTASNVQNQNANIDEKSFGGRVGEASDTVLKQYALDNCMSAMARNNHQNNEIYIHDLNSYAVGMHNCLSIPFDDLLKNGFNTRQTDVRPAQSVNTAFQLVAVIFQLQSLQQFGGVSATHLDWTMVPYVRKSFLKHYIVAYLKQSPDFLDLDLLNMMFDTYEEGGIIRNKFDDWVDEHKHEFFEKTGLKESDFYLGNTNLDKVFYQSALYDTINETYQAAEGLFHNLNTLQSRSGNQLPFTSINYGTCTSLEGRMVIKALLDVSIKGIGKLHKTSIFPCSIFQCMKGVNRKPGDQNYDLFRLALRSTAQRLYPNYANVDWSGNAGYDIEDPRTYFSTMGCRTANGWDVNGFGQLKDGRGNICPVTIIMPTLAMEVKTRMIEQYGAEAVAEDESHLVDRFIGYLDNKIYEAKDMLIERFNWISHQSPDAAKFMYENHVMAGYVPEEGIVSALKHGTLGVGQIGLAETLQILIGCDHTSEKGMALAKRIEKLFHDRCKEFKEEYKLNFGVYLSPSENLCYTSMNKFKEKYGVIKDVSDKDFFTNSIHVPVWIKMTPMEKIDIESQLTGYSNAGCITYVELDGSVKNNIDAIETIVNYAMDKDIPYFAINVPNDMCTKCGYTDDIANNCPMCGGDEIRRLRRVTGYLTGDYTTAFNKGKQQEVEMRVKHQTFK